MGFDLGWGYPSEPMLYGMGAKTQNQGDMI
jgi:hypothetical protein